MKRNVKLGFLSVIAALTLSAGVANASVVFSDNFDSYTNGTLSGQGGWTATAAAATPMQVAGAVDKYVQINTSGQDEYKAFSASIPHTDGNTMTTSFNINLSAAQATGDYFAHLSEPLASNFFFQRLFAKSTAGGYLLGITCTSGTGATTAYGTTVLNLNQEYHVDVNWNFVAGAVNDTFSVAVDSTNYVNYTWDSVTAEPAQISAANLRQGSAGSAPTVQFDDYTVSGVVPEPAAAGLLASVALLAFRRRKAN